MKINFTFFIFLFFLFIGCKTDKKYTVFNLNETYNENGNTYGENIEGIGTDIKIINCNFKRINSIKDWTTIDTLELLEKTEFGDVKYYYKNGLLEKIIVRNFGDTSQLLTEYYLLKKRLSFVYEKSYPKDDYWLMRSYFINDTLIYNNQSGDCGAPNSPEYMLDKQKRIYSKYKILIKHTKTK